jgi:hypothetical protein
LNSGSGRIHFVRPSRHSYGIIDVKVNDSAAENKIICDHADPVVAIQHVKARGSLRVRRLRFIPANVEDRIGSIDGTSEWGKGSVHDAGLQMERKRKKIALCDLNKIHVKFFLKKILAPKTIKETIMVYIRVIKFNQFPITLPSMCCDFYIFCYSVNN